MKFDFKIALARLLMGAATGVATGLGAGIDPQKLWPTVIGGALAAIGVDLHAFQLSKKSAGGS